ncbi:Alpha/beta hydrolase family-domain-containing protein [Gymnopilus junonius]|uniref:Alpha/beta hydrolase family-domain-containing protein n=1 Tax=Gymnopilus junonius TaxID=109634 RepID=A0A9P5TRN9_GYMJU|nr:Alpha/beta hydrolase family-domain-containing protein [Gymnopilus junonius]
MDPLSGKPHFPYPPGPIRGEQTVNPRRKLAPLLEPPTLVPLPNPLPKALHRKCAFTSTHTLSVHILPAAFPRAPSARGKINVPPLESFKGKTTKADRKKWLDQTVEQMFWELQESQKVFPDPKANIEVGQIGLWSTVLRIRRNKSAVEEGKDVKGITLVATHPIGFHKEIWEPTFRHLIEMTESSSSSVRIEEIWSLEAVNHGDAGLINDRYLPKSIDRSDYGRDIANFLIHHLPEGADSFGKDLPIQLSRLPSSISSSRVSHGFSDRNVVSLGHSLGGDATALCGISYPKLFSAMILLETTLFPVSYKKKGSPIILSTLGRRSSWPSREEARKGFLKAPLFQAFDPEVLDIYVEHGLYEDEKTGEVRLKCEPAWEASEFNERRSMNEGWELLPTLDERIELRWIMGGKDSASDLVGGPEAARSTVWRRARNASNVRIPGAGHLVVQEKPRETAEDIALFLNHKFGRAKRQSKL